MQCPACSGIGVTREFAIGKIYAVDCPQCDGAGEITDPNTLERIATALERIATALERIAAATEALRENSRD